VEGPRGRVLFRRPRSDATDFTDLCSSSIHNLRRSLSLVRVWTEGREGGGSLNEGSLLCSLTAKERTLLRAHNIKIVSHQWIESCLDNQRAMKDSEYRSR
jgi:hypothetical protein